MGNTNLLQHTCMTPTDLCTNALSHDSKYEQNIILKKHKVRSTEQIKQSILKYIETNKLQLYSVRERKVLETLVSVEQEHVGDKILELDKRIKLLENQKREVQRLKNKELSKITKDEKEKQEQAQSITKHEQKETQITQKITSIKDKRRKLFQDSQCLLLQDLDMIFQQIPKFDQNYEYINSILSLSGALLEKAKQNSEIQKNQSSNHAHLINQFTKTCRGPPNKSLTTEKTQTHHTTLGQNIDNHRNAKKDKKTEQKIQQLLKIQDKKSLKKNPTVNFLGSEVLKSNGLLMIVPIECFSGIGALRDNNKTGLPSGASLLQILMNKIKAVNLRRGCNLGIAFLVNEKYMTHFNEQIQKTQGFEQFVSFQKLQINSNLSNHENDQNYRSPIPYNIISFKNIWPSFDADQKIVIDSVDDQIVFSTHDGDLFAFVQNSIELKTLIEKYRYVNITNINNLLSQIGDAHVLGFLEEREEVDIAVKVLKPKSQQVVLKDYFALDDQQFFVLKEVPDNLPSQLQNGTQCSKTKTSKTVSYIPNQKFLDTEEYYVKSRIFIAQSGPLKRLLMSRISRKLNPEQNFIQFYLHRSISSVMYSKFTAFITVDEEYEFSNIKTSVSHLKPHVKKNGQIGYSKYCKKLLGIKENSSGKEEEEMVEIDAGILHKGSEEISRLINSLKKVKEVGFPIILYSDLFNNTKTDQ